MQKYLIVSCAVATSVATPSFPAGNVYETGNVMIVGGVYEMKNSNDPRKGVVTKVFKNGGVVLRFCKDEGEGNFVAPDLIQAETDCEGRRTGTFALKYESLNGLVIYSRNATELGFVANAEYAPSPSGLDIMLKIMSANDTEASVTLRPDDFSVISNKDTYEAIILNAETADNLSNSD